jgi:predicted unusual protein kinase regulating ubiquinone biosynthesis (AarF/ABC1/UbiB family)
MKEQKKIPVGKVQRAGRFVSTGARVGGNYLKYYTKKLVNPEHSRDELDEDNAEDIYNSLSELKGSALKVAQMLSMDQGLLPGAYSQRFTQAQYNAPPLSYPLVVKTFQKDLGNSPDSFFDSFTKKAAAAASIGQVHKGELNGKVYAVKVQYPGVADSIHSDLKLVKPIAMRMFNITDADITHYLSEVEERLIEECNYELELERSMDIASQCAHIDGLEFPKYLPDLSGKRILTMEWLPGKHMEEFLKTNPDQETRNRIGQAIWDFYDHQIHQLKQVHADPHPGNFLFRADGSVGVIDFGCVKVLSESFYNNYFRLLDVYDGEEPEEYDKLLRELQYLLPSDKASDAEYFKKRILELNQILGRPFHSDSFDFGNPEYFGSIYKLSEELAKDKRLRSANGARGPKDALYVNRTYFGLYSLLNSLGANVQVQQHKKVVA